jgi:hypothetical protein
MCIKIGFITLVIVSIYIIFSVGIGIFPQIPSFLESKYIENLNSVFLNLSYSFLAACFFYIFSVYLPNKKDEKILYPMISQKINHIYGFFSNIYLEFSRDIKIKVTDAMHDDDIGRKLLFSIKDWGQINNFRKRLWGENITYYQHIYNSYSNILILFDLIIPYSRLLTAEQIKLIEEIRNSPFFTDISTIFRTKSRIAPGDRVLMGFIDLFIETKNKMLKLKKIQDEKHKFVNTIKQKITHKNKISFHEKLKKDIEKRDNEIKKANM